VRVCDAGVEGRNAVEAVRQASSLAASTACQVFDLARSEDLPGAMLMAVLQKQRQEGREWADCLELIVSWNHVEIMKW
jgi:hypothetical protein